MTYLPITAAEVSGQQDFILIIPEAYVDHPSFGHAVVSRLIQAEGFSIAIIPQPQYDSDYKRFGEPKYAFMVSGGVVDSMVNNYNVSLTKRSKDEYSEGGVYGKRPDRAVTVYSQKLKSLYPHVPVIIGGIEASLRRFAHYDYWADKIFPSILVDSNADLLIYGMGERPLWDILSIIKKGASVDKIKDVDGTAYMISFDELSEKQKIDFQNGTYSFCPSMDEILNDKVAYVKAYKQQYQNANPISGKPLIQKQSNKKFVIQNKPQAPLTQAEMDKVYAYPYMRNYHPSYEKGVPSIEEVKFSITSHRGCFGSCSYCALSYHQGRVVSNRSKESIVNEARLLTEFDDFKGYIHDIGGPTANFRNPSCEKQLKCGVCKDKPCIGYEVCPMLKVDHSDYLEILRETRALPKIKKVFIRSGIRFDYLSYDRDKTFFKELVANHVSGQLKVAPEHCSDDVLKSMNKPPFRVYKEFHKMFTTETRKIGKEQYLVPYLISSHPNCTLENAKELTDYLMSIGHMPEQVQDFYPTPSTKSTTMFYSELDMETLKPIYVAKEKDDKRIQRALLQYKLPQNKEIVDKIYNRKPERINSSAKNIRLAEAESSSQAFEPNQKSSELGIIKTDLKKPRVMQKSRQTETKRFEQRKADKERLEENNLKQLTEVNAFAVKSDEKRKYVKKSFNGKSVQSEKAGFNKATVPNVSTSEKEWDKNKKGVDKNEKPWDKNKKGVDKNEKPWDKNKKAVDRNEKPWDKNKKAVDKNEKIWDKSEKPKLHSKPLENDKYIKKTTAGKSIESADVGKKLNAPKFSLTEKFVEKNARKKPNQNQPVNKSGNNMPGKRKSGNSKFGMNKAGAKKK